MSKKIEIIGSSSVGRTCLTEQERGIIINNKLEEDNNVFELNIPTRYEKLWIDPKEPVFNSKKHIETCNKNRKKRKKKSRK